MPGTDIVYGIAYTPLAYTDTHPSSLSAVPVPHSMCNIDRNPCTPRPKPRALVRFSHALCANPVHCAVLTCCARADLPHPREARPA
eukprot:3322951-Rhodomonas_salina.2